MEKKILLFKALPIQLLTHQQLLHGLKEMQDLVETMYRRPLIWKVCSTEGGADMRKNTRNKDRDVAQLYSICTAYIKAPGASPRTA